MTRDLIRRDWDTDAHKDDCVRTRGEDDRLQAQEGGLRGNQPCQHLGLRLLASRSARYQFVFLKPLCVWYFVTAALANSYKDLTEKARGRDSRGEGGGGQASAKALRQGHAPCAGTEQQGGG